MSSGLRGTTFHSMLLLMGRAARCLHTHLHVKYLQRTCKSHQVFRKKVGVAKQLKNRQNQTWVTNRSVDCHFIFEVPLWCFPANQGRSQISWVWCFPGRTNPTDIKQNVRGGATAWKTQRVPKVSRWQKTKMSRVHHLVAKHKKWREKGMTAQEGKVFRVRNV